MSVVRACALGVADFDSYSLFVFFTSAAIGKSGANMDNAVRIAKAQALRLQLDHSISFLGKVGEGTFGVVKQARHTSANNTTALVAIKTFKPAMKEGEGFNKDAIREIALLRELRHPNIVCLRDVILCPPLPGAEGGARDKSGLYLVFDYAEHDLYEILKHHRDKGLKAPNEAMVRSVLWQILNGIAYLHANWIVHRDLKPSNILVMGTNASGDQVGPLR